MDPSQSSKDVNDEWGLFVSMIEDMEATTQEEENDFCWVEAMIVVDSGAVVQCSPITFGAHRLQPLLEGPE